MAIGVYSLYAVASLVNRIVSVTEICGFMLERLLCCFYTIIVSVITVIVHDFIIHDLRLYKMSQLCPYIWKCMTLPAPKFLNDLGEHFHVCSQLFDALFVECLHLLSLRSCWTDTTPIDISVDWLSVDEHLSSLTYHLMLIITASLKIYHIVINYKCTTCVST